ncbi:fumarylacetoacetate hydrolase family protein [Hydrogenophaga sp.]|uniref:fumarylacetoacetate hydrolase family protein n=1 Tax=Hydrogenophaga sp. TaxID=1904254 RepID=UPI002732E4CF|nr:fumarylacetoacetate hydrolase family protein [Hydrogenophaga sp.]MDP3474693.1 fumarylacetoacetate hydrolase family protein [Hydrogenophaga sp.]
MKLASLQHGRDGRLVVVSRDLTRATDAFPIVPTLQAALDDWDRLAPRLADLAVCLEHGSVPSFRFHEHDCAAPLPRAYGRLLAAGTTPVPVRSGGALGPREAVRARDENAGLSAMAGLAVITGDVPAGTVAAQASTRMCLVMLACQVMTRQRASGEDGDAAGAAEEAYSFSPVVVTPDEIGPAWQEGRLDLPVLCQINQQAPQRGDTAGAANAASLIAEAARAHALGAGTIIGVAVPMPQDQPLRFGDTVRIEMKDRGGHSIFGAIEQEILPAG